jgi:hypothetical protein
LELGPLDQLVDRQGAEHPQQVVQLVGVAGAAALDAALELVLDVDERGGVEQVAQLLGAEQLAQQVAVERQRRGSPFGQRRVVVVHELADPGEQQRLGERRRAGGLDGHGPDAAGAQVGEHLAQGGQVEHVVEALAGGLEQDREGGVLGGDGLEVGGPLALLPQGGAAVGAAAGQQQGPAGALPEAGGEHGGVGEGADDQLVDVVGVDEQLVEGELVDGFGEAQGDAVVAPHEVGVDAPPFGEAFAQGHGPGGVDLGAEG